jgi:hypothetical protein
VYQLGLLALGCGTIESTAIMITEKLISTDPEVARTVILGQQVSKVTALAAQLAPLSLAGAPGLAQSVITWMKRVRDITDRRNRYLRAVWFVSKPTADNPEPNALLLDGRGRSLTTIPIGELQSAIAAGKQVALDGNELLAEVTTHFGVPDALQRAFASAVAGPGV